MLHDIQVTPNTRWGSEGRCVINIWTGALDLRDLQALDSYVDRVVSRQRDRVAFMTIIAAGSGLPGKAERAEAERFYERASRFTAVAQVIDGGGMWASAVMSASTALGLLGGRQYPAKAFRNVNDAVRWIATSGGLPNPRGTLERELLYAVARLREADAPAPR